MAVDHLLLETGDKLEVEGGTTHLVLESSTSLSDSIFTDGTSVQFVASGGNDCYVVHDASAPGIKSVTASANQGTITQGSGTAIRVTI